MEANPFSQKDKWQKFFYVGFAKHEVDSVRAVKNDKIPGLAEYITDDFDKLSNNEKLRILQVFGDL